MRTLWALPLLLTLLAACGGSDAVSMPGEEAIDACHRKLTQVASKADADWKPQQAVADKYDRYWEVQGESAAGGYYWCRINADNERVLSWVY